MFVLWLIVLNIGVFELIFTSGPEVMTATLFCQLVNLGTRFDLDNGHKLLNTLRSLISSGALGEKSDFVDVSLHVSGPDSAVLWVPSDPIAIALVKRGRLVVNPNLTVVLSFGESAASRFILIKSSEGQLEYEVLNAVGDHLRVQLYPRKDGALVKFLSAKDAENAFDDLQRVLLENKHVDYVRQVMVSDYCVVRGRWSNAREASLDAFLKGLEGAGKSLAGKIIKFATY